MNGSVRGIRRHRYLQLLQSLSQLSSLAESLSTFQRKRRSLVSYGNAAEIRANLALRLGTLRIPCCARSAASVMCGLGCAGSN